VCSGSVSASSIFAESTTLLNEIAEQLAALVANGADLDALGKLLAPDLDA
jgi:hypothetical protein